MYRMVIVDDDVNAIHSLHHDFPWEQYGFSVAAEFENGLSALEWLKKNPIDVILCDIKMPGLNGIELARFLHEEKRKEILILISGYKDFEYAQKAIEYKVRNYLIKPVTFREMQRVMEGLKNELDQEQPGSADKKASSQPDLQLNKIRRYVELHCRDVTLNSLSEHLEMNSTYVSSYYRNHTGEKLFDYITRVRMNEAMRILRSEANMSLTEVAEAVGYSNAVSFSRSFKKQFGIAPSEFRRDFEKREVKQ